MQTVKNMAAQGDVMFIRIDSIPETAAEAKPDNGIFVVAHSETGHNHVVEASNAQMLIDKTNDFIAYLRVSQNAEVKHQRSFDTHESLLLTPGNYQIRRQREYVAEGFRKVAD